MRETGMYGFILETSFLSAGAMPLSRPLLLLLSLALLVGCDPPNPTSPAPPPPSATAEAEKAEAEKLEETWDALFMNDTKVGYTHTVTTAEGADHQQRRHQSASHITLQRYGQQTKQTITYGCLESAQGELLEFDTKMVAGPTPSRATGQVVKDKLMLSIESAGKITTEEIAWNASYRGFFGDQQSLKEQPMKPGEERTFKMLMPLFNQVVEVTFTAQQVESTFVLQQRRDLLRIDSVMKTSQADIRTVYWTDDQGEVIKVWFPGVNQTSYRSTKDFCLKPSEATDFDLGLDTTVKVAKPLTEPHATKRIAYRVGLKYEDPAEVFASGGSQTVIPIDDRHATIVVRSVRPPFADPPPKEDPPIDADKAPNNSIQSDDARVVQMAQRIAAGEDRPVLVAFAMEQAVHDSITQKNFSQAFATAAEVAKSLEGDCTEHAVLLAALCRARGLPSRVAMGLIYYPQQQSFAYHMWTETWITDRWVPLDATLGRGGIGAAHLKIAHSNMEGSGAFASFLPVVRVLGQLELEIEKVE